MATEERKQQPEYAARLKAERVRLGMSHEEMGDATGVSRATQFAYEKGDRVPDLLYLSKAREEGVDVLFVVTGVRERSTPTLTEAERQLLDRYNVLSPPLKKTVDDVLSLASTASAPGSTSAFQQVFHGTVGQAAGNHSTMTATYEASQKGKTRRRE